MSLKLFDIIIGLFVIMIGGKFFGGFLILCCRLDNICCFGNLDFLVDLSMYIMVIVLVLFEWVRFLKRFWYLGVGFCFESMEIWKMFCRSWFIVVRFKIFVIFLILVMWFLRVLVWVSLLLLGLRIFGFL